MIMQVRHHAISFLLFASCSVACIGFGCSPQAQQSASERVSTDKAAESGAGTSESLLIVETLENDKVVRKTVGIVAFVDGERAFIAFVGYLNGPQGVRLSSEKAKLKHVAVVGPLGKQRRVDLDELPFGELPRFIDVSLSAPKDRLPPPIRMQKLPKVAVGQTLIGLAAPSRFWQGDEPQLVRYEARVDKILTSSAGDAIGFSIAGGRGGALLNDRDEIIALTRDTGYLTPEGNSDAMPTDFFQRAWALRIQSLRIRETRSSPKEVKLEFLLQTCDPHATLHARQRPRLLLTHLPEDQKGEPDWMYLRDQQRFVTADGSWKKPGDGSELEFQPATKWDEEFDVPAASSPQMNIAHWYASYTFSLDKKLAPVFYQAVAVDAQSGKIVQPLDFDSHVKVPAEQPLPLLFRHPVHQSDAGVPIFPKHPGGGRILPADPLPTRKLDRAYELPKPTIVNRPLIAEVQSHGSMTVARLNLSTMPGPPPRKAGESVLQQREIDRRIYRRYAAMVASPDGKFLYVVDGREGLRPKLHKIDTSTWSDVIVLDLPRGCWSIGLAAGGLVVPGGSKELWIVDPDTLEITKLIQLEDSYELEIATHANVSTAYILSHLGLLSIDTVAGRPIRYWYPRRFESLGTYVGQGNNGQCCTLNLSADGRYLLMANDRVHRMRIEGVEVVYEGAGKPFGALATNRLSLDEEMRYATVPISKQDGVNLDKLMLYDPKTLQPSSISLDTGPEPTAVAFDISGGRIFAASKTRHVMEFDVGGKLVAECALGATEDIKRITVIPKHGAAVYWGDVITVVDKDPKRLVGIPKASQQPK